MNYKGIKDRSSLCLCCGKEIPFKYYNKQSAKYCSMECQLETKWHKQKELIEQGLVKYSPSQRKYLSEKRGYVCEECGIHEWNNSELVLQVDHIDGNPDNNYPDNLRLLCPNCHSLTPTYKGGNKNVPKDNSRSTLHRKIYKEKGRPYRGLVPPARFEQAHDHL